MGGKHFEILVDLGEAVKVRKKEGNLNAAVLGNAVFLINFMERWIMSELEIAFGSSDFESVAENRAKIEGIYDVIAVS